MMTVLKDDCKLAEVTGREYLELKINALEKITDAHFKSIDIATNKSEENITLRLHNLNNVYSILKEKNAEFVTKAEHAYLQKQLDDLRRLVYVGVGILLTLEIILRFLK